jgi:S1-C subfamily serine protease
VHLFSGIHGDYHRPSDDVERFEAEGAARVTELARALVARLQSRPLEFVLVAPEEGAAQRVRGGFDVWFGTVPEYAYEGQGLLLAGTSAGSPAEKAGLLKDDVVVQVGEVEVETIYDFMHALQIYKPGDVVLTRYLRDGVEEEVRVTLATRGEP